ncbi:MAG: TonB-dependent receptor [Muribaculaceae bacterium]|nr:TonB-dependent receptor [Muribaculaceae bacterium]
MKLRITFLLIALIGLMSARAQNISWSGTVVDREGEPLIGVSVVPVDNPAAGTSTDIDGKFHIQVAVGSNVKFSYVGFNTKIIKVAPGENDINVVLEESSTDLDEVVVIGYGVQKKKLVTGATTQVKGEDIASRNTVSAIGALQGQTPGVNITSLGGKPNSGFKVNIRGVGTNGDSNPIVVVDGLVGSLSNLAELNPNDIESLDVLKDAASTAIYGARAANGVILVTTKHGAEGRTNISFDAYVGWQNIASRPQMLNAKEYMYIYDVARMYEGNAPMNWQSIVPGNVWENLENGWEGTDWLDLLIGKNAPQQSYNFGVSGGSAMGSYAIGLGYTSQEGVMLRDYLDSKFERLNARINSDWNLIKVGKRNLLKFGENLMLSYTNSNGLNAISTGGAWSNTVRTALKASPLMPAFDDEGNFTPGASWLNDSQQNPLRAATRGGADQNNSKGYSARGNFYLQLEPIDNLVLRSTLGFGYYGSTSRSYSEPYNDGVFGSATLDQINQSSSNDYAWSWENTIAYNFKVNANNISALLGMSAEKWGLGEGVSAMRTQNTFGDWLHAYVGNGTPIASQSDWGNGGWPSGRGAINSYFGRLTYDYDSRYMATATLRADGSSNFARGHRWGYFPSFSAGWNIDQENFMESTRDWLNQLKLRASWGQNGNCNIANFQYLATVWVGGADYFFGSDKWGKEIGSYPDKIANPDLTWERSEQWNVGIDTRFLNTRLSFVFDWYRKITKDWLVSAPILASYGTGAPTINGGDVRNQGIELGLNWNDKAGDFSYSVGVNLAYNTNKVTRLANDSGTINGPGDAVLQNSGFISRIEVGEPIGFFYGYKTLGVFQNQAQIDSYVDANGDKIMPQAVPGDVIFYDRDGDGQISDNDKMNIGDPHPDVTLGLNLQFFYKGFDLGANFYGAFGQQIANCYRDHNTSGFDNWTYYLASNVWTGEGTSNRYPRPSTSSSINWSYISDVFVDDADYFRLQSLTFGYDFKSLCPRMPLGQCRLYVSANNLFTITKYKGFDPEIGTDGNWGGTAWVQGVDQGFYPTSRTFLVGVNLKF